MDIKQNNPDLEINKPEFTSRGRYKFKIIIAFVYIPIYFGIIFATLKLGILWMPLVWAAVVFGIAWFFIKTTDEHILKRTTIAALIFSLANFLLSLIFTRFLFDKAMDIMPGNGLLVFIIFAIAVGIFLFSLLIFVFWGLLIYGVKNKRSVVMILSILLFSFVIVAPVYGIWKYKKQFILIFQTTDVLEGKNITGLSCTSSQGEIESAFKDYGFNLKKIVQNVIKSSIPDFELDSIYPSTYECGEMVGCWECLINNEISISSWADKNNNRVLYTVRGRRERESPDVKGFRIEIKIDYVSSFDEKNPFSIDPKIAEGVVKYIKDLTFIKDIKLKEISTDEYVLKKYEKETAKYYGDWKFLGISAKALAAKVYAGDKKTNYASNAWITPPGPQPDSRGFPSYFQSSFSESPKLNIIYYDYNNDGIVDEKEELSKINYVQVYAKLLLNQGYTLEELNKAQEWRGQGDIFAWLGMSANPTISIPNSTQHFAGENTHPYYAYNYDMKFENEKFDISAHISNVLVIIIEEKGSNINFSY